MALFVIGQIAEIAVPFQDQCRISIAWRLPARQPNPDAGVQCGGGQVAVTLTYAGPAPVHLPAGVAVKAAVGMAAIEIGADFFGAAAFDIIEVHIGRRDGDFQYMAGRRADGRRGCGAECELIGCGQTLLGNRGFVHPEKEAYGQQQKKNLVH